MAVAASTQRWLLQVALVGGDPGQDPVGGGGQAGHAALLGLGQGLAAAPLDPLTGSGPSRGSGQCMPMALASQPGSPRLLARARARSAAASAWVRPLVQSR